MVGAPWEFKKVLFLSTKKRNHYCKDSTNRGTLPPPHQKKKCHRQCLVYIRASFFNFCVFHTLIILVINSVNAFDHRKKQNKGRSKQSPSSSTNTFSNVAPGLESQLCPSLAVWYWGKPAPQSFCFLIKIWDDTCKVLGSTPGTKEWLKNNSSLSLMSSLGQIQPFRTLSSLAL